MSKKINIDIEEVKRLYVEENKTTIEIASIIGCHPTVIQDRLRPFGILRKAGVRTKFTEEENKQRKIALDAIYNSSEAAKNSHRRRCIKDREKVRARGAVANAIKSGRLLKASEYLCTDCGLKAREYDHYLGYSKENQLSIQPVCSRCNKAREKLRYVQN